MAKPEPISAIIDRVIPRKDSPQESVPARLLRQWPVFVSPAAAAHTQPVDLVRGVLIIRADHASWVHELTLRRTEIVATINTYITDCAIRAIRVVVGTVGASPSRKNNR